MQTFRNNSSCNYSAATCKRKNRTVAEKIHNCTRTV